jgi:hypothetical protein
MKDRHSLRATSGLVAAALISAVTGASAGCSSSPSTPDTSPPATADASTTDASAPATEDGSTADTSPPSTEDASTDARGARSAPSQGGTSGTIDSVSKPSFTLTTGAGQKVTVDETSSTTYDDGTSPISASAIVAGQNVLVLGIVNSTTITATQVTLLPSNINEAAASAAAGVVPFQPGTPSPSKQVGQVPENYQEGQGTIVSGTTADQATENALNAYPGVVVDRVVQLNGGDGGTEYEAHCISVNWPHHIFVDQSFSVVGAD